MGPSAGMAAAAAGRWRLRPGDVASAPGRRLAPVGGHGGGSYGNGEPGGHGLADSVVNSALRFRAQAPLVDQLLREIGVQGGEIGQIAQSLSANALPAVPKAGE